MELLPASMVVKLGAAKAPPSAVNELRAIFKASSFVSFLKTMESGSAPLIMLFVTEISVRLTARFTGSGPVILFPVSRKIVKESMLPKLSGMVPVTALLDTQRTPSLDMFDQAGGSVPLSSEFPTRTKEVSLVDPHAAGSSPVNFVF